LSDYQGAAASFRRGLEIDPANSGLKSGLLNAEARIEPDASLESADDIAPTTSPAADTGMGGGMADILRNLNFGGDADAPGGGGGMPNIASLMNNPAMMQMAQQMMANGGMERLMSNPSVANMVHFILPFFSITC